MPIRTSQVILLGSLCLQRGIKKGGVSLGRSQGALGGTQCVPDLVGFRAGHCASLGLTFFTSEWTCRTGGLLRFLQLKSMEGPWQSTLGEAASVYHLNPEKVPGLWRLSYAWRPCSQTWQGNSQWTSTSWYRSLAIRNLGITVSPGCVGSLWTCWLRGEFPNLLHHP